MSASRTTTAVVGNCQSQSAFESRSSLTTADYLECEEQYAAASLPSLPVVLRRGLGARLWDIEGKVYIDFLSAFSVVNQGHCHPRITKVMVEQCQQLTLTSRAYHNEYYPLICKRICDLLGFDMAFPMNSGSESVDLAIKVARKWGYNVKGIQPDEALVITITGNYHGKSLGPLSASDNGKIRNGYGPFLPGVGPVIDGKEVRFSNIQDLEDVFVSHGPKIAALMIEPVQGYAGCLPTHEGYLQAARNLCNKHKVLLVADEIQSGFGRTGYLMAYQKEGVKPDMVVLGKALTGGVYTMGMVVGTREVMSQMQQGEHSSTFSGNPLACAVALEAINVVLDEKLPQRSLELGDKLIHRLASIECPHTTVKVTGRGLFCSFSIDESHRSGLVTAARLTSLLRKRGVLAFSVSNRVRIAPPLMIPEEDLWAGVSILESSLHDLITAS